MTDQQPTFEIEAEIYSLEILQREDEVRREKHAIAGAVYTERIEERASEIRKLKRIVEKRKFENEKKVLNWLRSRPSIPTMAKAIHMEIE